MFQKLGFLGLVCAAVAATVAWPAGCEAYVQRLHFPLTGHRNYPTAKGSVTFSESFGETERKDGATLIVEVSNVPLPPGTELVVLIHEREVGTLTLTKQRTGRLVLESGFRRSVPRLGPASFVVVKIPAGSTVVW
jgi:hypothetical protein